MMFCAVLLVTALLTWDYSHLVRKIAVLGVSQLAQQTTTSAAQEMGGAVKFNKSEDVLSSLSRIQEFSEGKVSAIRVELLNGDVIQLDNETPNRAAITPEENTLKATVIETGEPYISEDGMTVIAPIPFGKDATIVGVLVAEWTTAPVFEAFFLEQLKAVAIAAILMIAVIIGTLFYLRRVIKIPIMAVSSSIDHLENGDYDTVIDAKKDASELGRIIGQLAQLRSQLSQARAQEQSRAEQQADQKFVVAELSAGLSRLSKGDLTQKITVEFNTESEALRAHFNETVDRLNELVRKVVENSRSISEGAVALSNSSEDLSRRTELQATTLADSANAIDKVTVSVKSVADGATLAETIVSDTETRVNESERVVRAAVQAMEAIQRSSGQMSQIISAIDDISFQTNLLALNAGVEAARAGDAGSGFAVVASEVRALAQRSSDSAHEIGALISTSNDQVEDGAAHIQKAGDSLADIVASFARVKEQIEDISSSAVAQSDALDGINESVIKLDRATQSNAAMAEETTAASHTLTSDAQGLTAVVGAFSVLASSPTSMPVPSEFRQAS